MTSGFTGLLGRGRGGGVPRENPRPGHTLGGPRPYDWFAVVERATRAHVDSFDAQESAVDTARSYYETGEVMVVGMSGPNPRESVGLIDACGHQLWPKPEPGAGA